MLGRVEGKKMKRMTSYKRDGDNQKNHEPAIQRPEDPNRRLEKHCPYGHQESKTT